MVVSLCTESDGSPQKPTFGGQGGILHSNCKGAGRGEGLARAGGGRGGGGWIWIRFWDPILRLIGCPGRSTMAFLTTLHISRPCHAKCTPQALGRPSQHASLGAVGPHRPSRHMGRSWCSPQASPLHPHSGRQAVNALTCPRSAPDVGVCHKHNRVDRQTEPCLNIPPGVGVPLRAQWQFCFLGPY